VTDGFVSSYRENPRFLPTQEWQKLGNLVPYFSLADLVSSLERPRKVMIMVKAGFPVDAVIAELVPLLENGDIIIDCGNSLYHDTIRRTEALRTGGIEFVGCGVSGGEEGALHGPSIMPGCTPEVYAHISPILESIAARDFSWGACVSHIGTDGSGHYVKMIHNGIEYAVMQMIAEAYEVFRKSYGLTAPEIAEIFDRYNTGVLDSYLIEITAKVLRREDSQDSHVSEWQPKKYVIDSILDRAGAKGTGLWTSIDALESGMSVSSIVEATFARMISADKSLRSELGQGYEFDHPVLMPLPEMTDKLEKTLYLGMLFAYAQGLALIDAQSEKYSWDIDLAEVTRIWQGGCIIRSQILTFLTEAFAGKKSISHIFALAPIHDAIHTHIGDYQEILSLLIRSNIATPALSSAIQYFYQMVTIDSSANMIQGLRDYFWAHTYERNDKEGIFHTEWSVDEK
jgi:6-phosphogluconate dehydrogenase